jgi:hypothetical protein
LDVNQCEEFGYRPVSDEEYREARYKIRNPPLPGAEDLIPDTDWIDPRKGDRFGIIDALVRNPGAAAED